MTRPGVKTHVKGQTKCYIYIFLQSCSLIIIFVHQFVFMNVYYSQIIFPVFVW